jgi:hypothetical protein
MKTSVALTGLLIGFVCMIGAANTKTLMEKKIQEAHAAGVVEGQFLTLVHDVPLADLSKIVTKPHI